MHQHNNTASLISKYIISMLAELVHDLSIYTTQLTFRRLHALQHLSRGAEDLADGACIDWRHRPSTIVCAIERVFNTDHVRLQKLAVTPGTSPGRSSDGTAGSHSHTQSAGSSRRKLDQRQVKVFIFMSSRAMIAAVMLQAAQSCRPALDTGKLNAFADADVNQ